MEKIKNFFYNTDNSVKVEDLNLDEFMELL
jgi:hypothetical protein